MSFSQQITAIEPDLTGAGLRVGIVISRFNPEIGDGLRKACVDELIRLGVDAAAVTLASVPGALELPLVLQTMAQSGRYHALVAIGCVIRGETYHFEVVSNESARGILDVQLNTGIPIANAVLTTEDDDQALARMAVKGAEAAQAAVEMANLLRAVK
ncbi:riboflavin synthase beta chain [Sterolibacterium denitrificans]|uniref:6,7-dimethyl-8-ribityllumazine synthase n=1 Tax=Sterolibacterium denitrificans TaxID=157592 RepID=A0A7Z7HPY0_9PROT|nr:6,7-dimethyl-8-ribityllumazine synthase [Sterolibacterium denitrificans]SMB23837.1 riboflavin synthase beta chain [Sterolibacterium denitrificans]